VVEVSLSVVIARPGEDVFAYVAHARNDPEWCPKLLSVPTVARSPRLSTTTASR